MPDTKRTASGVFGGLLGLVGLSAAAGVLITATVTPAIALTGVAATSAITMFDKLPSVLDIDKLMLRSGSRRSVRSLRYGKASGITVRCSRGGTLPCARLAHTEGHAGRARSARRVHGLQKVSALRELRVPSFFVV
jgi:hypothetical protein